MITAHPPIHTPTHPPIGPIEESIFRERPIYVNALTHKFSFTISYKMKDRQVGPIGSDRATPFGDNGFRISKIMDPLHIFEYAILIHHQIYVQKTAFKIVYGY